MATSAGVNSVLSGSINTLRSRSRQLRRNNPLVSGGVDSFVSDLIGTGISPSWQLKDRKLKKELQELWNEWVDEADWDGNNNFYGLQSLISSALIESGEAIVKFHHLRKNSGLVVPFQLQVLEGDHLPENKSIMLPNGNTIRMGIEFNKQGKRVAYHLYREHPGESFVFTNTNINTVRIPAKDICHVFRQTRPGQIRGASWLAPVLVKLHDYDQYDDAELVRKKTAAMFGGYITEPAGGIDPTLAFGKSDGADSQNREIVPLEPGTFPVLPAGMDVKFSEPADVGGNYERWVKQQLRMIAKGIGTTYEKLTGDLTEVNYSSIRAGLLSFQRFCKQIQMQTIAFQLCKPVVRGFLNAAVLSGAIELPGYAQKPRLYLGGSKLKWRPDGWAWVDPVKDQMAEQMAVRNGFKSREQVIAEQGGDIEEIDTAVSEGNVRADELGLVFDSDPRKTAKAGTAQSVEDKVIGKSINEED